MVRRLGGYVAVLLCTLGSAPSWVLAEDTLGDSPKPVDPYARDPKAPVPPPGEARGWDIRPAKAYRPEVRWLQRKTADGIEYSMEAVFTPLEGVQWLTRRSQVVKRVEDVLYFGGDDRTYGALPSLSYESDIGAGVGASLFHKDVLGNRERIAAKASLSQGYNEHYQLSLDIPSIAGSGFYFEGLARYEESELFFYGIGNGDENPTMTGDLFAPRDAALPSSFRQNRDLLIASAGRHFGQQGLRLRLGLSGVYNRRSFLGASPDQRYESIDATYDTQMLTAFEDGEDILELTAELTLDTRDLGGKTGSGFLLDSFAGGAPSRDGNQFLHYGVEASFFQTLFRESRVLVFRMMLEGVEPRAAEVPFSELPRLGGVARLRGYRTDRFRDNLATIASVEYRYPIHHLVSGALFAEAGKVAQNYDELVVDGLADHWRPALGFGFLVHTLTDVKLRVEVSYGDSAQVFFSTDALAAFRDRRRRL